MSDSAVVGYDAIGAQTSSLPRGAQIYAGYSTGSGIVPWTASQFAQYATALGPCLRIDQNPSASDPTADYLDVENGAATFADAPGWAKRALASFKAGTRPGQRSPAIYMSAGNVSAVVDALVAGGVTSGIGLIVANWSITEASAVADVMAAAGPFPVAGIQLSDPGPYDVNIFSRNWLINQSGDSPYPILQLGASGTAVVTLQTRLNVWHASPAVVADGSFGALTETAVKAFQTGHKLTVDGSVGPLTWAVLNTVPPVPVHAPVPGQLPPPTALAVDHSRIALGWHAVTGAGLTGYTATAYGIDGKSYATADTPVAQPWAVLSGLAPGGTYTIKVWANGGKVAPLGTEITVTLPT